MCFVDASDDRESACHSEVTIGRPAKWIKYRQLFATVADTPIINFVTVVSEVRDMANGSFS